MDVSADWQKAAEGIVNQAAPGCLVLVVGVPDAGKSTFCAFLASQLHQAGLPSAVVDADVGQSSIGPPTAISGGFLLRPIQQLAEIEATASYFVGSISPAGHLLPTVVGVQRIVRRLQAQGAQAVVIDSSGLVLGSPGRALKEHKVDLLQPSHIVAIQRQEELAGLLRLWRRAGGASLSILRPSPAAVRRSPQERRRHRARRFAAYFREAAPASLRLDQVALRGTLLGQGHPLDQALLEEWNGRLKVTLLHGERLEDQALLVLAGRPGPALSQAIREALLVNSVRFFSASYFNNVLCGLLDQKSDLLSLAILHHIDFAAGSLRLLMPRPIPPGGRVLHLGRLLLRADGSELGMLRPGDL